ncbi:PREDICTED: protein REVEILLE 3 isoform X3 [Brassica oleracea var. oleracea]|uniref:protein REVEILLE 3 isoform X3 n=1 Tax=Brassica oleracea var. oleracea TaxID=109376 RepID=UPI0006A73A78|nr:PREDICTED: protein REVEILLE 3 isoform X3 [Brassica oleracea var. oleracea]
MNMNLPGFSTTLPHSKTTMPVSARSHTMSFSEDPTKMIRKPYTITKSRENWTEQEHDKFIEALHLFDRDWKKIEAFVGSKTVIQKNGTNEHLPPPRPKRKANHPYPQKASKSVALTTSNALLEHEYLYTTDPQPLISTPNQGLMRCNVITPIPVIKEELGVLENCCSTSSSSSIRDQMRTRTVTETDDQRVMPNFDEVYSFIGSVFDPKTTGHVQRLKQMDPINLETVLLLMKNLSVNLSSPEFEEQRRLISSYNGE